MERVEGISPVKMGRGVAGFVGDQGIQNLKRSHRIAAPGDQSGKVMTRSRMCWLDPQQFLINRLGVHRLPGVYKLGRLLQQCINLVGHVSPVVS